MTERIKANVFVGAKVLDAAIHEGKLEMVMLSKDGQKFMVFSDLVSMEDWRPVSLEDSGGVMWARHDGHG